MPLQQSGQVVEPHGNVDVVVPRYEAAVAYGTEYGAAVEPIVNAVPQTNGVDGLEYAELLELHRAAVAVKVCCEFVAHWGRIGLWGYEVMGLRREGVRGLLG